jgi:hypothetical protein
VRTRDQNDSLNKTHEETHTEMERRVNAITDEITAVNYKLIR